MSLTRKMLKEMGIEEENAEKIILAHAETVDALKSLSGGTSSEEGKKDEESYKARLEELKREYDDYRGSVEKEKLTEGKKKALGELLSGCGVHKDAIGSIIDVTALDGVMLDEKGGIIGKEALARDMCTKWSAFIPKVTLSGAETADPPRHEGEKIYTREDLKKMSACEINKNYEQIRKSLCGGSGY